MIILIAKIYRHSIYFLIRKAYDGGGGRFHNTYINTPQEVSQGVNNSSIQRQDNSPPNVNIYFLFAMFYAAKSHDVLFRSVLPRVVSTNNQTLNIIRSSAITGIPRTAHVA